MAIHEFARCGRYRSGLRAAELGMSQFRIHPAVLLKESTTLYLCIISNRGRPAEEAEKFMITDFFYCSVSSMRVSKRELKVVILS